MYTGLAFAAVAVIVITSSAGGMWLGRRRRAHGRAATRSAGTDRVEKEESLARIESAVTDLLQGVTASLNTMIGDSRDFGQALDEHRQSLERMASLEDLHEVKRRLLEQAQELKSANDSYQHELDAAHVRVQDQKRDLELLRGQSE